ncbi:MAG TPA: trypsin-like peptidase domain-containing protein [Mycobacteriales bacterium]|nr:trypsin-like peptidase domain-containing protein [Mycobacteriales bacterium]
MWSWRRVLTAAGCVAATLSACTNATAAAPGPAAGAATPVPAPAAAAPTAGVPTAGVPTAGVPTAAASSAGARSPGPAAADGQGRTAPDGVVRHVGALFHAGSGHFCTGALVAGGAADLVVTAAHCVSAGAGAPVYAGLDFAPAYGHGTAPYGRWAAARVTVDPRWTAAADPDLDVAFVELAPRDGRRLSDLLGADRIGFGPAAGATVRLTGYPDGADDAVTCLGTPTRPSAGQLRIACTGYPDGTSGSPWLTGWDPDTGTGTVVGVIGGYQQGGTDADVSYSPYFGADVRQLYARATAAR